MGSGVSWQAGREVPISFCNGEQKAVVGAAQPHSTGNGSQGRA